MSVQAAIQLVRRPLRPVRRVAQSARYLAIGSLLRIKGSHAALLALDRVLPLQSRGRLHRGILRAYRRDPGLPEITRWPVRFAGQVIDLEFSPDVPFSVALRIIGQDPDVKAEYARLLQADRPALFLDVGANIGLDTVALRVHGVETISFEPNAVCHSQLRAFAAAAGVTTHIEPVALSDQHGEAVLVFPRGKTVLGSIDPVVQGDLSNEGALVRQQTLVRTLDDYFRAGDGHVLIKIDTEGHELGVLRGANRFLTERRATVIFESLPGSRSRSELHGLLTRHGYIISRAGRRQPLSEAVFLTEKRSTNYIAWRA